jgi:DNA-binding transcriptional LysR family regulator
MFSSVGAIPRIVHTSAEFGSHIALVAAGQASALVPRLGRGPLPPSVVAVPLTDPAPLRTVTAVWRRTMETNPGIAAVLSALTDAARTVLDESPAPAQPAAAVEEVGSAP